MYLDALALVWRFFERGLFFMSRKATEIIKVPRPLFERMPQAFPRFPALGSAGSMSRFERYSHLCCLNG